MTETVATRTRLACEMVAQTARLMIGIPDYQTCLAHRPTTHPGEAVMAQGAAPRLLLSLAV